MRTGVIAHLCIGGFLALCPGSRASDPLSGEVPAGPAPVDTAEVEPDTLGHYLDSLGRQTDRSFSTYSLAATSFPDSVLDSLLVQYERTGEPPKAYTSPPPRWRFDPGVAHLRFNRVEGLAVMPKGTLGFPFRPRVELFGAVGYGTASEEFTWETGLQSRHGRGWERPGLHLSYARRVDRYGSGGILGNSVTSILLGEDYDDYFLRDGWAAGVSVSPGRWRVELTYRAEEHDSIATAAGFALFKGDDAFRPNPPVDVGMVRLVELRLRPGIPPLGLSLGPTGAIVAGGALAGEFEYQSLRGDLIWIEQPWFGDRVTCKVTGGVLAGGPPYQALHHLGGFKTLRGYEVNEIHARKFLHLATDYEIGTNLLRPFPILGRLGIQFAPFFDGAVVFEIQEHDGTIVDRDDPDWRFATGLGLQKNFLGIPGGVGQLRVDITRRLDRDDHTMTYRAQITVEP